MMIYANKMIPSPLLGLSFTDAKVDSEFHCLKQTSLLPPPLHCHGGGGDFTLLEC